jgi:hypothetical protein
MKSPVRFVFSMLVVALVSAQAFGQSKDQKVEPAGVDSSQARPVAEAVGPPIIHSTNLRWLPAVQGDGFVLTVSAPDGRVFRKLFKNGQAPSFDLKSADDAALPDGQYQYELHLVPVLAPGVREALERSRETDTSRELVISLRKQGLLPDQEIVQSGGFQVRGGAIVASAQDEAPAPKTDGGSRPVGTQSRQDPDDGGFKPQDVVTPDDIIVQGSACIGLDCVNNESFGFDTIRLKENNTRIKFDDTSTGAGFPNVDWQLTANDSASGGQNKFSIEDITNARVPFTVTALAPTNSMFIASNGRVGLRTSTPVLDLHLLTGDTPAVRLDQSNTSGFTAQTWDVAANEANFFVRDVTSGSRLPLRIRPGAPTSSLDIAATGNVGLGTGSPSVRLHVVGAANTNAIFEGGAATHSLVQFTNAGVSRGFIGFANTGTTGLSFFNATGAAVNMLITDGGNIGLGGVTNPGSPIQHNNGATLSAGGVWTNASSRALKTNIRSLSSRDALFTLRRLNPVTFEYRADTSEKHVGFIAEDVPELVATSDRKGLSAMDVVAVLTRVVQEQQQTISELQRKVQRLETAGIRRARARGRR